MTQQNKEHIALPGFKEGDIHAFQRVFEQFFPSLCYFAQRLINDREEAEDIVLELFTKLWQRKEHFETIANIKAFLYISTRNTCLNYLQYRQRKTNSQKEFKYIAAAQLPVSFDFELINAEVMQEIHRQMEELPRQCREIFKLIFFQGLTTADIAARLKISPKTVLNQKLKAISLIRAELLKRKLFMAALFLSWMVESHRGVSN